MAYTKEAISSESEISSLSTEITESESSFDFHSDDSNSNAGFMEMNNGNE